eukprot:CAMPEP_0194041766 /NCGR_PEP_ID=MMETSP0009_2-20130614/13602_1 /TAXON_ID=210454 /ORGANISM="Grammatophora oceanica, Strain CCMP 410" /LENGTH=733 /DNA_ID=CAMNT_0038685373 /DNA_START=101 /DNA_END=2302 /DNA_ORIENTATION=-
MRSLICRAPVAALLVITSASPASSFSSTASPLAQNVGRNIFLPTSRCFLSPSALRGGSTTVPTPGKSLSQTTQLRSTATTTEEVTETMAEVAEDVAGPKLVALRASMAEKGLDVVLVPSDDPHLSEYTPDAYKRRGFLTDFHGSAGTALVTQDEALLWTDSRYFNEANLQLDARYWKLMKQGQPKVPTIPKFLGELAAKHYKESSEPLQIGIDPFVHPAAFAKEVQDALGSAARKELDDEDLTIGKLETSHPNLVDPLWESRPPIPTSPFRVHPLEYAGLSVADKVEKIRAQMTEQKATLAVFCTLDDVAYLLNMRSMGDVETCPVGIAYATISHDQVTLYCDAAKVQSPEVKEHLADVVVKPYDDIVGDIKGHCEAAPATNKVWMDKSRSNLALVSSIPAPKQQLVDSQNAVTPMKACKNEAEMEGMRKAHIVDGAAMAKFMAWLEHTIVVEGRSVSEVEVDEVLTGCRAEQPGFMEVSFPTIAGVGSNGAIIHYRAQAGTDLLKSLDKSKPILIDSGGQYLYGTTDVTRTWHFGEPTEEFRDLYTRVLKGNIGVDTMVFPENTPGFVLDVFARKSLWEAGKDYGHGTGHGVGAALNVHEGPHSISPRWGNKEAMKKGMVVSNEPGYYEDGNFGIRIENLLECQYVLDENNEEKKEDDGESAPAGKKFLKFDKLTMIPIQKNLIKVELLSSEELDWLDSYHEEVFAKVSPLLEADSPAMKWLEKSCVKMDRL